jgi:PAS domain S-box-containing protein
LKGLDGALGLMFSQRFVGFFRLPCLSLLLLLGVWAHTGIAAEPPSRNILVLFSNEAELPANQLFLKGLKEALAQDSSDRIVTHTEFLDLVQFPGREHEEQLAALIKAKYAATHIDLVVVAASQALDFISQYRDEIAPGAAIVFAAISRDDLQKRKLPAATTGIISRWDIIRTLELARALDPQARGIVFVTGASSFDRLWEAEGREKLHPYESTFAVTYLAGLTLAETLERVRQLPRDTIILSPVFFEGGDGTKYIPRDALQKIAVAAGAPTYAAYDPLIGLGPVGGYMDTFDGIGREAGRLALRIVKGEKPDSIAPFEGDTHRFIVDWRALKRWGLSEAALPPGTEIRFKQPSAWEQYKFEIILILVALLLQSLAILKLSIEARRRRAAESDARASKDRMDVASAAVNLGLWDWDLKTGKIWATSVCRSMFGMKDDEELTRQNFSRMILDEDRSRVRSEIDLAIAERRPFETEYRVSVPAKGPRWIATKGSPRSDGGSEPSHMVGVVLDITQRKKAELEAEQQRHDLAHLTRVSVLGALSGAVAHELNQPLTAILTNAQAATRMLAQGHADIEEIRQILEDIIQDDKRAGDVIKHLRALLKKGKSLTEKMSINDLVSESLALAHSDLILRAVAISTELGEGLPAIHGDPIQLQQVLLNLIVNACEAMGGRPNGDRLLFVKTAWNGDGHIRISVSDTGEGVAADQVEKLFEPFYSTKTLGLGLGLPICRSIVTAHGGRLWAEPASEQGAVFHIELPVELGGHA